MNNLLIIVLPALALGGFAYGVWQRQMARHDAERAFEKRYAQLQEDYGQLQVDHGVDLAHLGAAEQELERLKDQTGRAKELCQQLQEMYDVAVTALATSEDELESMTKENEKLHIKVQLLISAMNKQPFEEKGKVDEDTMGATTQTSPKPRTARQRKAT